MALLDISLVTKSLTKLLEESFKTSSAWTNANAPTISPRPPTKLPAGALGLYLYHLSEDGHCRNLPPPGRGEPPVRYVPMGLNLYYQLTAKGSTDDEKGTLQEQLMLGIAMKTLHDYPVIGDSTEIGGVKVFPAELQGNGNRLRIVLQPIAPNEAVNYWTAGTTPLQLAGYYQVSIVLIEPEKTEACAGRVLVYGAYAFVSGAPRLEASQNTLSFAIPGEPTPREAKLRPAQVPVGGSVEFIGSGHAGGEVTLLLRNSKWKKPVEADSSWAVTVKEDRISANIQTTVSGKDILPGIYGAVVKVERKRTLPDGRVRTLEHMSNECPFAITPRIDSVDGPDAGGVAKVEGYIFKHSDLASQAVQVYVGEVKLKQVAAGTLNPGEFKVVAPAAGATLATLELRLPAGFVSGQTYALRIFVDGAESPPNWIKKP